MMPSLQGRHCSLCQDPLSLGERFRCEVEWHEWIEPSRFRVIFLPDTGRPYVPLPLCAECRGRDDLEARILSQAALHWHLPSFQLGQPNSDFFLKPSAIGIPPYGPPLPQPQAISFARPVRLVKARTWAQEIVLWLTGILLFALVMSVLFLLRP